tara:strand:+ start:379 stop:561 length:183 start_codon:yes stop_codon:yes gene_type:complete
MLFMITSNNLPNNLKPLKTRMLIQGVLFMITSNHLPKDLKPPKGAGPGDAFYDNQQLFAL